MRRKTLLFLLTLLFLVPLSVHAKFQVGKLYYNITNDTLAPYTVEVTAEYYNEFNYYLAGTDIVIPEYITYNDVIFQVTGIGEKAFYCCTINSIKSVTIPNSVTSIGYSAFYGCSSLTSVTIPNSVTSIGSNAFYGCSSLTSVTIPNSVTSIGSNAFLGCTDLTSVTIPNSVTSIGYSAFSGCSGLTSVTIGNSVTSIGYSAFSGCTGLTSVTIPNSVTSIEDGAFSGCTGLTSVTIGNSVTIIGNDAFSGCTGLIKTNYTGDIAGWCAIDFCLSSSANPVSCSHNLYINGVEVKDLVIPDGVTSIGKEAFSGCSGLTSVTIPNSVTSIEDGAFFGCTGLTSVTIPNNVMYIGSNAFSGCTGLTSVTIPNNVYIGSNAFNNVFNILYSGTATGSPWGALHLNLYVDGCLVYESANQTQLLKCNRAAKGEIVLPESVTLIDKTAFSGCTGITSITIPNNVTSIGKSAFDGCSNLTSVIWHAKNYPSPSQSSDAPFYNLRSQIASFTFGDKVESIPAYLCYGMSQLASVTIPDNVTSINNSAFNGCSNLTFIVWHAKNYPSPSQASNAPFYNLRSQITSFVFGDELKNIPDYLCAYMSELTSIKVPDSVINIGNNVFRGCTGLTSVTIPDGVTSIGDLAFCDCSSLTTFTIPNNITSIGTSVFSGCSGLTSITIPNSVTDIGASAFSGCSGLTAISIPNSVTNIGGSAFYGCTNVPIFTVPNSVTEIGKNAFYNMPLVAYSGTATGTPWGAKRIISESLLSGWLIFEDEEHTVLKECIPAATGDIVIPETVTKVNDNAFYKCIGVISVTIPKSVTDIGANAFAGCRSLTSVTIPENVTNIGSNAFASCPNLTSIIWNVKNYPNPSQAKYAPFYGIHSQITSVVFGKEVETIPAYMCQNMSNLASLAISDNVRTINNYAFNGCTALTSVTIPESVTKIGTNAFSGCTNLTKTNYTGNIAGWCGMNFGNASANPICYSHNLYINDVEVRDLVIPDDVTKINAYSFYNCSNLASIACQPIVPPTCGTDAFYKVPTDIPVYLPCGTIDAYLQANNWKRFSNLQEPPMEDYTIVVNSASQEMGQANLQAQKQNLDCEVIASVSATANYGYHFTQWNDGITDNPRTVILTQDTTLIASFEPNTYSLSVGSNNYTYGTAIGSTTADYLSEITILATANYGYHFEQWSDGNTDNPRTINLTQDIALTAVFVPNQYTLRAKSNNSERGIVTGGTKADYLSDITIAATANAGYYFKQWNDGNTDNPRTIRLTQDTTFTAEFEQFYSGKCGNNLYWAYEDGTINITGRGEMYDYTETTQPWLLFQNDIKTVSVCNTATYIGEYAFANLGKLTKLHLGAGIETVGANAFAGCLRLGTIYSYATLPPLAEESSFANYNARLYVPCEVVGDYQLAIVFGNFKYIECISSEGTTLPSDKVTVVPSDNDATFTWPSNSNAGAYSLVITKDGVVFCTLTFNGNGQLTGIAFAPARDHDNAHAARVAQATVNGWQFTVTGLDEKSNYAYTLTVTDNSDKVLKSYEGTFTTTSSQPATKYAISVDCNAAQGTVTGGGTYDEGTIVTLTAMPLDGYIFSCWSDGNTDNPRSVTVTADATYTALFEEEQTALDQVSADDAAAQKILRNGQVLIQRGGKLYTLTGEEVTIN